MKRYSFTLEVAGIGTEDDRYEDALYEAGCDDALISVVDGKLRVDFDREAASYDDAVQSGAADVARAGGKVVKALPLPSPE
ncbi:MAG: hypothetical protein ACREFA_14185 [Stellaceae bacterium]